MGWWSGGVAVRLPERQPQRIDLCGGCTAEERGEMGVAGKCDTLSSARRHQERVTPEIAKTSSYGHAGTAAELGRERASVRLI